MILYAGPEAVVKKVPLFWRLWIDRRRDSEEEVGYSLLVVLEGLTGE